MVELAAYFSLALPNTILTNDDEVFPSGEKADSKVRLTPYSSTLDGGSPAGRLNCCGRSLLWLAIYSKMYLMFLEAIWSRFQTLLQVSQLSNVCIFRPDDLSKFLLSRICLRVRRSQLAHTCDVKYSSIATTKMLGLMRDK